MRKVGRAVIESVLGLPALPRLLSRGLLEERAIIFMLHRFECLDRGIEGHDAEGLRRVMERLRAEGREIVSLRDILVRVSGRGPPLRGAVAFTVDDGYVEHAEIAAPLFSDFDVPATFFLTTGFVDGDLWHWWDQIEYMIEKTTRMEVSIDSLEVSGDLGSATSRVVLRDRLCSLVKSRPQAEIETILKVVADTMGVSLPTAPPERYRPLSWCDVRSLERRGLCFGAQTVSHPILSKCSSARSAWEIEESWSRLSCEARDPHAVFCFPNGKAGDFGEREISVLRTLGFEGAVTSLPAYVSKNAFETRDAYRYTLPRFAYVDAIADQRRVLSGFERLRASVF